MPWPCGKKKENVPDLHVYFIPPEQAESHPLTRHFYTDKPKIASAAVAASILIPIAAHGAVGLLSNVAARSSQTHVLDLQQEVLLEGCYNQEGSLLLDGAYLCFCIGGTTLESKDDDDGIPNDPTVVCIWKLVNSQDGTAIRLERTKWEWQTFLQPPEKSFWTCQSLKFRDVAITIEIDYLKGEKASWEFVFTNVTEDDLSNNSTLLDTTTDWEPAPTKPSSMDDDDDRNKEQVAMQQEDPNVEVPANLSSEGVEAPFLEEDEPTTTKPATREEANSTTTQYYVPANIRVDVIETTRPHVLAPLLHESAKAGSSVAAPLSKLVQSQFTKIKL